MKRFLVKQAGISEVEYIREFVVEIPDGCTEEDVECMQLDNGLDWELDLASKIISNGHVVLPYDESHSSLPVVRLEKEVDSIRKCDHEFETELAGNCLLVKCEHCGLRRTVDDPNAEELGEAMIGPYVWEDMSRVTTGEWLSTKSEGAR